MLQTTRQPARFSLPTLVKAHPLITLYLLIYILAWPFLLGQALQSYQLISVSLPPVLGTVTGWAPAIAALIVTGCAGGRAGVRQLLQRVFRWRVSIGWYVLALLALAVLILAGVGIYSALTGVSVTLPISSMSPVSAALTFLVLLVLGVVFNTEEVAWRGVALPRLQAHRSTLLACLLIAVPETLLHLPYFFIKDSFYQLIGPVAFTLFTVAEVILFAWVFNNARGSVLIVTLLHASQNAWSRIMASPTNPGPYFVTVGLLLVLAAAVVVGYGPARLSHKPEAEIPVTV